MKKIIPFLFFVLILASSVCALDLTKNLISYYSFDAESYLRNDSTNNDFDLTVVGASVVQKNSTNCVLGSHCLAVNDTGGYLTSQDTARKLGKYNYNFSVCEWFQQGTYIADNTGHWSFRTGDNVQGNARVSTSGTGGEMYSNTCNGNCYVSTTGIKRENQWFFGCWVFNYTDATHTDWVIYMNATAVGVWHGNPLAVDDFSGDTFYIGNSYTASQTFNGLIDEVGVWNQTLSLAEIQALYNNGLGCNPWVNPVGCDVAPDINAPNIYSPNNATMKASYQFHKQSVSLDFNASETVTWSLGNETTNFQVDANGVVTNKTGLHSNRSYYFNVSATDSASNRNVTPQYEVNVNDTDTPNIILPSNKTLEWHNGAVNLDLNYTDESNATTWDINYTSNFTITTAGVLTNTSSLGVKQYYIEVNLTDQFGNKNTTIFNITVYDTNTPNIYLPSNKSIWYKNTSVNLQVNASEVITAWTQNATNLTISSSGALINNSWLPIGNYTVNFTATDTHTLTNSTAQMKIKVYCIANYTNTSWGSKVDFTGCQLNDTIQNVRNLTEYDSNGCPSSTTTIYYNYSWTACNNCSYVATNTTFGAKQDTSGCQLNDTISQVQNKTEYDSNYSTCYALTNLPTDLWNSGNNNTFYNYSYDSCNNCSYFVVNSTWGTKYNITGCQANMTYIQERNLTEYDSNYSTCYALTNLPTDLWNSGNNISFFNYSTYSCDSTDYNYPNIYSPTKKSLWYKNTSVYLDFNASELISTWLQNVTNLSINTNGILTNSSWLPIGNYSVNVSANDTSGNMNSTIYAFKVYCISNYTNTTYGAKQDLTACQMNDTKQQEQNLTQYDSNYCPSSTNTIFYNNSYDYCNYCSYNALNSSWSTKQDTSGCQLNDTISQVQNKTEYDSNYSTCYALTNLPTDLWNSGNNNTFYNYSYDSCNNCSYSLAFTSWGAKTNITSCQANSTYITERNRTQYDSNYSTCYALTGLASDLWNAGANITSFNYSTYACTYIPPPTGLARNLLAYYSFDNESTRDNFLNDTGGYGFNMSKVGNSIQSNNGDCILRSCFYSVLGDQGYLASLDTGLGSKLSKANQNFTVSQWFNGTALAVDDGITHFGGLDGSQGNYRFSISSSELWASMNSGLVYINNGSIRSNQWYFGVLVYNITHFTMYINTTIVAQWVAGGIGNEDFSGSNFYIGTYSTGAKSWAGKIDEVGVWNSSLTLAEIQLLYNNGLGCSPIGNSSGCTIDTNQTNITLFSPNNIVTNISTQNLYFNVSAHYTIENVSLYVDGKYNRSNSTPIINNANSSFTGIAFKNGLKTWSIKVKDSNATTMSLNNSFYLDSKKPKLFTTGLNSALTIFNQSYNITWSLLSSDSNSSKCWYWYSDNATVIYPACNSTILTEFTTYGVKTFYYCSNDTLTNRNCSEESLTVNNLEWYQNASNTIVGLGDTTTYYLTLNMSGIGSTYQQTNATLNIDGTQYTPSQTITTNQIVYSYPKTWVSGEGSPVGMSHYGNWSFYIKNSTYLLSNYTTNQTYNTTVITFGIDDCTNYTQVILNYSIYDETTKTQDPLVNQSIEVDLTIVSGSTHIVYNSSSNGSLAVCLPVGTLNASTNYVLYSIAKYQANNHAVEYNYLDNVNLTYGTTLNINLYTLNTDSAYSEYSTSFIVNYLDKNFLPVNGAIVDLLRYYVGEGTYTSVEHGKTNNEGDTRLHLVTEDIIYKLIVRLNNSIIFYSSDFYALCKATPCQLNFEEGSTFNQVGNFTKEDNINYQLTLDEDTRTVTSEFATNDGSTEQFGLRVIRYSAYQNETVCENYLTTSGGTLTCIIPTSAKNTTYIADFFTNETTKENWINGGWFNLDTTPKDVFGATGIILTFLLFVSLVVMAIPSGAVLTVVAGILGVIVASMLSIFYSGSIIGVGSSVMWLIIAGVIIIWKASKRGG